jgi:hypothetical protein
LPYRQALPQERHYSYFISSTERLRFWFARDLAVHVRRHPGSASGQTLPALDHKFLQQIGVLVIDRLSGDIHRASGFAQEHLLGFSFPQQTADGGRR